MTRGKCALCHKNSVLKKSHIVPKLVSKWLKKTSATGFMRGVKEPKKQLQDLPTLLYYVALAYQTQGSLLRQNWKKVTKS